MSAAHRGDMYHFRAALQIENCSVVLYDSNHTDEKKTKTGDLEEYLKKSVLVPGKAEKDKRHIFIVPWNNDQIKGIKSLPNPIVGCSLDGADYNKSAKDYPGIVLDTYSEKASTEIIASAPSRLPDVTNGMTILSNTMVSSNKFPNFQKLESEFRELSKGFRKLWDGWEGKGVKAGKNAVLLMYRNTGTKDPGKVETMGVYPELDNGNATRDIENLINEIAKQEKKTLTVFTCGLEGSGIGEYWNDLEPLRREHPEITKRDFEAYFLKWSYHNERFMMATGFRSGPFDLLTFMGIPTVSIGLRNLMGEPRHQLLADEKFKRVNIQYDQPRHQGTAAVISTRWKPAPEPSQTTFASPFWDDDFRPPQGAKAQRDVPQNKKEAQKQPPHGFAPFDKVVVKVGYMIALQKYLGWEQTISTLKKTLPYTVTTSDARFCYPFKSRGNKTALSKHFDDNENADNGDVSRVERNLQNSSETLQLSESMFKKYQDDYNNDWNKVPELIKEQMVLGRGNTWERKHKAKK